MSTYGIENHLKNLSSTYSHFKFFESTAEYSLISQSLESILKSPSSPENFHSTLKLILCALVDSLHSSLTLGSSDSPYLSSSQAESSKLSKAKSQSVLKAIAKTDTSFQSSRSKDLPTPLKSEDFRLLSEFSYSKGPTFPKQKRVLGDSRERIPGPSDYQKNEEVLLPSNPKITIPKSPRNINFVNSTTPAPGAYNPVRHFASR
jgi:hypothetical protein